MILLFSVSFISISKSQNHSLYINNNGDTCLNYVDIGNLNITGDKLTVEAIVQIINNGGCPISPHHDVVSKHYDDSDVNYLLRPTFAAINTANGYYETNAIPITENTCHHIAMVYDGSYLRFYSDDLFDSIMATGNLINNPLNTLIGYSAGFNPNWYTQYFGFIDEVRIWNVARTKNQIQDFAFTTLPDPTNQIGLMAYYDFQTGYQNKEGNNSYDGIPSGNCLLVSDSINCVFPVALNTLSQEPKISVYPNPFYSSGVIRFNSIIKKAELKIYDIYGKKIKTINEISGDELKLDRDNLSSGLYFIILTQDNVINATYKLMIMD
jgi:hypothetical protein